MSEVTERGEGFGMVAGNIVENLSGVDRDVASAIPVEDVESTDPERNHSADASDTPSTEDILDEENTFDVSRAEYNELRDLVLSLAHGVESFNRASPHKIPTVSINSVLGIG